MIRAIIFDMDGTLLNTLDDLTGSINHALALHGLPTHPVSAVRMMVGNGVRKLAERAVPQGTAPELLEQVLTDFKAHYAEHNMDLTAPYEGILPLLDALKARGIPCAITSNKFDAAVKALSAELFGDRITLALGEGNGVPPKPAPDMVYAAMAQLGVDATEALFVGDSDTDVLTAHNSGLPCVGVTWGFRDRDVLEACKAEYIIDRPEELLKFL